MINWVWFLVIIFITILSFTNKRNDDVAIPLDINDYEQIVFDNFTCHF